MAAAIKRSATGLSNRRLRKSAKLFVRRCTGPTTATATVNRDDMTDDDIRSVWGEGTTTRSNHRPRLQTVRPERSALRRRRRQNTYRETFPIRPPPPLLSRTHYVDSAAAAAVCAATSRPLNFLKKKIIIIIITQIDRPPCARVRFDRCAVRDSAEFVVLIILL